MKRYQVLEEPVLDTHRPTINYVIYDKISNRVIYRSMDKAKTERICEGFNDVDQMNES